MQHYRQIVQVLLLATATMLFGACGGIKFDESQYDTAIRALTQFESDLTGVIKGESRAWQSQLDAMQLKLTADTKDLVNNEVNSVLAGTTARLATECRGVVLNFEERIKANAMALLKALAEARSEIEGAKKRHEPAGPIIMRALEKVMSTRVFLDPCVTQFVPAEIRVQWSARGVCEVRSASLSVHGWGFLRPFEEDGRFEVSILSEKTESGSGIVLEERKVPKQWLATSTDYLMQLRLAECKFRPSDCWLVLKDKTSSAQPLKVIILHENGGDDPPPPPPLPAPTYSLARIIPYLAITAPTKHEHYGITVEVLNAKGELIANGVETFGKSNETVLREGSQRDLQSFSGVAAQPGDVVTFRVTSTHNADGVQLQGRWAALMGARFVFTKQLQGSPTEDVERDGGTKHELTFEHRGGLFQPNDRSVAQTFTLTVPRP